MVFLHGITSTLVIYYLATFFQGAKENSAIRSGVLLFPTACIIGECLVSTPAEKLLSSDLTMLYSTYTAPSAILVGRSVEITGKYLPQNYAGWMLCIIGFGLLSLLRSTSTLAQEECLQLLLAVGLGFLYVSPQFTVLAPMSVKDNATALALMSWSRQFGQ